MTQFKKNQNSPSIIEKTLSRLIQIKYVIFYARILRYSCFNKRYCNTSLLS
ncbi:hypothetical protein CpB0376 [Chlamydia pneumoniae TW-183]|uniref:Uncharacterized protein n=1 Tax=Chlamydia pneumoniae TaxID=83558 RepID=A0ABN3YPU0_CHLPN|nr:hypothetical protein CpB0376 [Chlamydia pneumoniae TW-183]